MNPTRWVVAIVLAATLGYITLARSASAAPRSVVDIASSGSMLDRSTIHPGPGNGTAEAVLEGGSFDGTGAVEGTGKITIAVKFSGASADADVVHGSADFATANGTFTLQFQAPHHPFSLPTFDGRWTFTNGTGAYSGVHGTGSVAFQIQGEDGPTPIIDAHWSGSVD
jgi:hypothetical protein